ncbi:unnamed protein product [Tenebrio molitor]|nr:unnamed protein product [Tenebrio molitor]
MKVLTFLGVLCLANCLKLPSTFTKCDKRKSDFNSCLSDAIKTAIKQLDRPMEEYSLPSLEPFFVPFFLAKTGVKLPFDSKFRNFKIFGHTKITHLKATMNFEDKTLTIVMKNPEMRYEFDYETKGVMFVIPIESSGPALVTAQNVTYTLSFSFEEYTRDGQKYFQVIDTKLEMAPQSMTAHFKNLFRSKNLEDAFNQEITLNWKQATQYFESIYFDSYAQGYGDVFNNFLEKVPVAELFGGV